MAKSKWMKELSKMDNVLTRAGDPYANPIRGHSPSFNFTFGNSQGLPLGYTVALYGPEKCGKSVVVNDMIGQLHQSDPTAEVIKFDTEMRDEVQMTEADLRVFGVDPDRYLTYQVNSPDLVFDVIAKEVAAKCQEGMPLKLLVIDSINNIQGRRGMVQTTIMTQQIGDLALTLQEGFKSLLQVQRKYKFSVALIAQARDEMDPDQKMKGKKFKMAASRAVRHYAEYFMCVERFDNKGDKEGSKLNGRADLLGQSLQDDTKGDMFDNAEKIGHKIKVTMIDSSLGPKGRVGLFTLGYKNGKLSGFINTHEEVFLLGVGRNVITKPNQLSYAYKDRKWVGKDKLIKDLASDKALYEAILEDIRISDLNCDYSKESTAVPDNFEEMTREEIEAEANR